MNVTYLNDAESRISYGIPRKDDMWCRICKTKPEIVIPRYFIYHSLIIYPVYINVSSWNKTFTKLTISLRSLSELLIRTSFIIFDREISRIINNSALELLKIQEQV